MTLRRVGESASVETTLLAGFYKTTGGYWIYRFVGAGNEMSVGIVPRDTTHEDVTAWLHGWADYPTLVSKRPAPTPQDAPLSPQEGA